MYYTIRACLLASALLVSESLVAQEPITRRAPVDELFSGDKELRSKAYGKLLKDRSILIEKLCAFVAEPKNHSTHRATVSDAISLLGKLRAIEAAEVLVENIGFPDVMPPDADAQPEVIFSFGRLRPVEERLPAIAALIEIGEPSVDRVIKKMLTTGNLVEYSSCVAVLKGLDTPSIRAKVERVMPTASADRRAMLKRSFESIADKSRSEK